MPEQETKPYTRSHKTTYTYTRKKKQAVTFSTLDKAKEAMRRLDCAELHWIIGPEGGPYIIGYSGKYLSSAVLGSDGKRLND